MGPADPELVLVGRVVKPHGLRGEVMVRPLTENPHRFDPGAELLLGPAPDRVRRVRIDASRPHKAGLLVAFAGVGRIEEAEPLREWLLFVEPEALGEPEGVDAFWEHQLVGLEVLDSRGARLGRIREVVERPVQDLWVVDTGAAEVLFPAARELVVAVDLDSGTAVVDPPEGLFE